MSLNINVNISALRASNRFQSHNESLSKSIARLTTGKKLNTSADSPVDMAIHNVNNGRLSTLDKGKQNLVDAISMVQTAEAAMERIDELLIHMKVMAEQSATGTYTNEQRLILASEYTQLSCEIDRIARYTEFKERKLLDGSISTHNNVQRQGAFYTANKKHIHQEDVDPAQHGLKIHFGPDNYRQTDYYFVKIGDLTMDGLLREHGDPNVSSTEKIDIATQHNAQQALETINTALRVKEQNRYAMGIMQNRLEASLAFMDEEMYYLTMANSALADTDLTREMVEFSRNMVLAEAASSMIAQANLIPRVALKLLNF